MFEQPKTVDKIRAKEKYRTDSIVNQIPIFLNSYKLKSKNEGGNVIQDDKSFQLGDSYFDRENSNISIFETIQEQKFVMNRFIIFTASCQHLHFANSGDFFSPESDKSQ